jgi:hypothetical protein
MISMRRARRIVDPVAVVLVFISLVFISTHRRRRSDERERSWHSRSRFAHVPSLLSAAENADTSVDQDHWRSGVDLGPYLEASVLPVLRANWYRLISQASGVPGGAVGVDFSLQKDGTLGAAQLSLPSEGKLDALALKAVEASGPYRVLPLIFIPYPCGRMAIFLMNPRWTNRSNRLAGKQ